MKHLIRTHLLHPRLLLCLATLAGAAVFAQPAEKSGVASNASSSSGARPLTKFNLDFPGGTPGELVAAIQKAQGRPLNVVVPTEHATKKLPALKMSGIDVAQLFTALELAGPTMEIVPSGNGGYTQSSSRVGFKTVGSTATTNDDSIWTFYAQEAPRMPKVARFYLLTPYLEAGLTVDDITTAIQTGWKMRGDKETPTLSFHKETKLLIAVGDYGLDTIDSILKALDPIRSKAEAAKAGDAHKTKP